MKQPLPTGLDPQPLLLPTCLVAGMGLGKTFQAIATLWTLLTAGVHGGKATCSKPLILCPSSLVSNWGKVRVCRGWWRL